MLQGNLNMVNRREIRILFFLQSLSSMGSGGSLTALCEYLNMIEYAAVGEHGQARVGRSVTANGRDVKPSGIW